jgi:transposase
MENASAAFLSAVQRSMVAIRKAVSAGAVDPEALSAAERRQHAGWLRREAENAEILALSAQGVAIKDIMRRTDKSRGLVRQVVRGGRADIFRSRMSSLDPFLTQLETAWVAGSQNGAALWRAMRTNGFTGSLRVVTEWATRRRKDEGTATQDKRPSKTPSVRRIARMMTTERDHCT